MSAPAPNPWTARPNNSNGQAGAGNLPGHARAHEVVQGHIELGRWVATLGGGDETRGQSGKALQAIAAGCRQPSES